MDVQQIKKHMNNEINKSIQAKKGYCAGFGWNLQVEFVMLTILTYPFLFGIFTLIDYDTISVGKVIAIIMISLAIIAHIIVDVFALIGLWKRDRKYFSRQSI